MERIKVKENVGYDFDRQRPIDNFIVDFYCKDLQLAIEVDGDSHNFDEVFEKDEARQNRLESLGVRFLRFDDLEVKKDMNNVLRTIKGWISENEQLDNPPPTPPTPPGRLVL